jgi:hypothetical protein
VRSDRELLETFEACTLPPGELHHADHIRLAFLYLRDYPPPEALARFVASLQRFAASLGKPGLYHETITWAYLLLIRERMARGEAADFAEFRRMNEDLFRWKPSVLEEYYTPATLGSELARRVFVMPDRVVGCQLSVVSRCLPTDN